MLGHLGEYCPYGADYTTLYENMLKTQLEFLGIWKQDDFQDEEGHFPRYKLKFG